VRLARGELALALVFAAVGVLWMVKGARMPLWEGFAPDSGFLPLVYGCLLTALALAVLALELRANVAAPAESLRKPLTVAAALGIAVAALPYAGFALSVFALLLFLYAAVERLPWLASLLAAGGTTAALYVIFKVWLGVPLPLLFR